MVEGSFKWKASEQSYATKGGRYFLSDHGFETPDYVFKEVNENGGVYIISYATLLYEYLTDKVVKL